MNIPDGYETSIHRSLVKPLFWMGVPRDLFLVNVFLAVLGGVFFKTWTVIFAAVGIHYLFRYLGQKDPQFHLVFWKARTHKTYYYR